MNKYLSGKSAHIYDFVRILNDPTFPVHLNAPLPSRFCVCIPAVHCKFLLQPFTSLIKSFAFS